jgi:hypothetical protein
LINKTLKRYLNLKYIKVSSFFYIFRYRSTNTLKISLLVYFISLSKRDPILIILEELLEYYTPTRPDNSLFLLPHYRSTYIAERDPNKIEEEREAILLLPPLLLLLLTLLTPSKSTSAYRCPKKAVSTLIVKRYYTTIAITNTISLAFITNRLSSSIISISTPTSFFTTGPPLTNFTIVVTLYFLTTITTPALLTKLPILKARSVSAPIAAFIGSAIPSTLKRKGIALLVSYGFTISKEKK